MPGLIPDFTILEEKEAAEKATECGGSEKADDSDFYDVASDVGKEE
jgi:hypothetical protein